MSHPLIPTKKVTLDKERTLRFGMYELCLLQQTELFGPNIIQFLLDAFAKLGAAVYAKDSKLHHLVNKIEREDVAPEDLIGIELPLDILQIRALIWASLHKGDPGLTAEEAFELAPPVEMLKLLGPIIQLVVQTFGPAKNGAKDGAKPPFEAAPAAAS